MTLPDGPYVAVVDRFEDVGGDQDGETAVAVLLLERDGRTVGDVDVPRAGLPRRARRQDAVLRVVIRDGDVDSLWFDARRTRERGASAQSRLDRIARRAPRKPKSREDAAGTADEVGGGGEDESEPAESTDRDEDE